MKTRKTHQKYRSNYSYTFLNGEKYVLKPGKDGVTEELIKILHKEDDKEVKNNLDEISVETPNKNYDPKNPKENTKFKRIYHLYFECSESEMDIDTDKSQIMFDASILNSMDDEEIVMRRTIIEQIEKTKLSVKQKQLVSLLKYGYKSTEIAEMLGISDAAITKMKRRIADILLPYKMFL